MQEALNKLRALCAAATPGKWEYKRRKNIGPNIYIKELNGNNNYLFDGTEYCGWGEDTALFIATAREAVPALIELVDAYEALQAANAEVRIAEISGINIAISATRDLWSEAHAAVEAAKAKLEAVCQA